MFSNGSFNSISLAIVTPSLHTLGGPHFLSSTTLRPLGPRVILTAPARASIPFFKARLASSSYASCLAIYSSSSLVFRQKLFLYLLILARMSLSRRIRYSWFSYFHSVPEYLA